MLPNMMERQDGFNTEPRQSYVQVQNPFQSIVTDTLNNNEGVNFELHNTTSSEEHGFEKNSQFMTARNIKIGGGVAYSITYLLVSCLCASSFVANVSDFQQISTTPAIHQRSHDGYYLCHHFGSVRNREKRCRLPGKSPDLAGGFLKNQISKLGKLAS